MLLHIIGSVLVSFLPQKGIELPVEINLVFSELTILIPSAVYILVKNLSFRDDLGFRPIKAGTVLMSILLSALVTPVVSFVNVLSQLFVSNKVAQMSDELSGGSNAIVLFLGALYGPFCEELLFRAIFNNRYEKYVGPIRAGLISSLFFALAHMNVNQAFYAFVLGMIFCVINKAAGSVYPSIIIHACVNGGNILLLFSLTKMYSTLGQGEDIAAVAEAERNSDMMYYLIGVVLVIAIICSLIAIPCVVWMSRHEGNFESLADMFIHKHKSANWLRVPTILAIVLVLVMMFGLNGIIGILKG